MARTKAERLAKVHTEAIDGFNRAYEGCADERRQAVEDRRFYSIPGAQWEGPFRELFARRPRLEVNKVHLSVMRIINEYRNNRITVDFTSKDGTTSDKLADTCDALYRADEQDSGAQEAYDNAFEEAVGGGFGAWRLRTAYENEYDDEDERQRIRIEPIYDADTSVFFDADSKRQDKSDAKHAWVVYSVTRNGYMDEWGDDPATWPKDSETTLFDWSTPDVVYLAEYYCVEEKRETIHVFKTLTGEELRYTDDDLEDMSESEEDDNGDYVEGSVDAGIEMLALEGTDKVREKRVRKRKVRKYIMSGGKVLEDCGYIAGKCIPIVPVYGKRWFVDNVERFMGQVRLAKDPQRVKNMQLSKLAELAALSPVEKPIFTPEQMAGHQVLWAEDNLKNNPYLLVNKIEDAAGNMQAAGPLGYTKPPAIPPAMAALLQLTEQDMAEILGSQQQADVMQPSMSGKAVELIQQRVDMQSFIYMSNFAKGMQRCGEIWLDMAREVYVEEGRKMKGIGEQGGSEAVVLNQPFMDEEGVQTFRNDLTGADFDVSVDVGPSFNSRRESMVRGLTGLMQMTTDPQDMTILSAMAIMNMEAEGLGEIKQYYRKKLVGMGVLMPNDQEREEMAAAAEAAAQQQQPDPQQAYLQAAAQKEMALADKAVADTELARANARRSEADAIETMVKLGLDVGAAMEIGMQPPPAA